MPNIYGLLNIGQSALLAQQKAIDITGNNIANVNTEGYSRQRLTLEQSRPVRVEGTTMSTGVVANVSIQRFSDGFINAQIGTETESLGRWEAQKSALEKVELMFDETSGYGLSEAMSEFWNAWQNVANNPAGSTERIELLSAAQYMTDLFNQASDNLVAFQNEIDTSVDNVVEQINTIASQISELNLQITQVEVTGHNANEYRDERDLLVEELSKLIDIDTIEDNQGHLAISIAGGRPLVEKGSSWTLTTMDNAGVENIFWQASDGTTVDITNQIEDGELKGWVETRDVLIADYLSQLDDLAEAMVTGVNDLHDDGLTLNNTDGINFFDPAGITAGTISVNTAVAADADLIAAAGATEGVPGGNATAIAIAELQGSSQALLGNTSFDDYYNSLASTIGHDVSNAMFNYNHQTSMLNQLENQRQEVAGVSLDEEMVELVKYQHAYNAAAKMITTADELIQTLLGLVR